MNKIFSFTNSLTFRISFFTTIFVLAVFVISGYAIEQSMKQHFVEQDVFELQESSRKIKSVIGDLSEKFSDIEVLNKTTSFFARNESVAFFFMTNDGKLIDGNNEAFYTYIHSLNTSKNSNQDIDLIKKFNFKEAFFFGIEESVVIGNNSYKFFLSVNSGMHKPYLKSLHRNMYIYMSLSSFFLVLGLVSMIRWGLHPVKSLAEHIAGMTTKDLHTRLGYKNIPNELKSLVLSFNEMAERIENVFQRQSNFSADIAHELRTPIAVLISQTQITLSSNRENNEYEDVLYSNLEELEKLSKMVNDMLFLAQADNNTLVPHKEIIDLKEEIECLLDYFDAFIEDKNLSVNFTGENTLFEGDRLMMRRAMSNIMLNAICYATRAQAIAIELKNDSKNIQISVSNSGAQIPPEVLSRLFDRFFRADPSRQRRGDGAGIGLAIVKSIIETHGGHVHAFSDSAKTIFTLTLPCLSYTKAHTE